jgi:5'(3')-deoxyribonucleotidase
MKPTILIDIDGVPANFIAGCLPVVKEITGRDHVHDDVDQFMIEAALGLDEAQTKALYERVCSEGWVRDLPLYEGAREGVDALREFADVVPVTAPLWSSKYWVYERYEWILNQLGIHQRDVIHAHAKWRIHGDMLVDDKMAHLTAWATAPHNRDGVPVLFRRKYNENEVWQPGVERGYRVGDWPTLVHVARTYFGHNASAQ